MGRYAKNKELKSGSYSIRLPVTPSSAVGPDSPVDGLVRYNDDVQKIQYYKNGTWRNLGSEGLINLTKDTFTGDGSTTGYTMTKSYITGNEIYILVHINNVYQNPGVAYTVNSTNITFTSPPPNGHPIVIIHGLGSTEVV